MHPEGRGVGLAVGKEVTGDVVGHAVVCIKGLGVGLGVVAGIGGLVGPDDGSKVGAFVVGAEDNVFAVGKAVVGDAVGLAVNCITGLEVGLGVGAEVTSEHPPPSIQHSLQQLQTTSKQSAFTAIVCGSWQTSNGTSPVK